MRITNSEELFRKFLQHPYISTDSRKAQPGSLFFALKGDSFNGNAYAAAALEQGAAFAVIDEEASYTGERTLLVGNVLESLQQLARDYRKTLRCPVIGITGTNGKTTTKELIATALSARFSTYATTGNLNNHIGVPITILNIRPETEMAVVEMGANHIGEIAALCNIARPTHGIITNIGKAHLEGFGSPEGVIKEKSELYQHLRDNGGSVFVNAANPLLMNLSEGMERFTYGGHPKAVFRGEADRSEAMLRFRLLPSQQMVTTHLAGSYNFENAMAALCIATHFRVELNVAIRAVEMYEPRMNRSQVIKTGRNTLILDAYNANPSSMKAALLNFAEMQANLKVAILGDMFELGDASETEHREILAQAINSSTGSIFTAGPHFAKAAEGTRALAFETTAQLMQYLKDNPLNEALVLIKGSRGMKMESITEIL